MEALSFLSKETAWAIKESVGTPVYVYDEKGLEEQADQALAFPNAFGLTVRYAMKSLPNAAILRLFAAKGIQIDASSGHEAHRAMQAGIGASQICISSQELPHDFVELGEQGVTFNACSLHQLRSLCQAFSGQSIGVRFNPGLGSGGTGKTNVGGPSSSFGIWYEHVDQVKEIVAQHNVSVTRIHTHIGSGSDPKVWEQTAQVSLDLVRQFPDVTVLDLGGGYKVARMSDEVSTDLQRIGLPVKEAFEKLYEETGRKIHLEIEPGTFLVARQGSLLTTIQDMTSTGEAGHEFLKLDAGMTEILRPSLYASQHPIIVLPKEEKADSKEYIVVGHCCESGDLLTPAADDSEKLLARELTAAEIGDLCVLEGVGAYCSAMSSKNYNSFPEAAEVLLEKDGSFRVIRRRQNIQQIWQNEC